jgi:PAS domain S-box-containing protein
LQCARRRLAPANRFLGLCTVSMWIALRHAVICGLVGTALAAASAGVWHLLADGATNSSAWNGVVFAVICCGALCGLVGGTMSLMHQAALRRLQAHAALPVTPAIKRRPRNPLRARISADERWDLIRRELCQLLRRSRRALRGRPVYEVLHPEDYGLLDGALRRARASARPQIVRCRFLVPLDAPQGVYARTTFRSDTELLPPLDPASFRHVRMRIGFRLGPPGRDGHFLLEVVDQSPRVEMQVEIERARLDGRQVRTRLRSVKSDLERLKESYRELYHNAPVMYFRLGVDGRLIAFNDTLIRTLGWRRAEFTGRSYADLLAPASGQPQSGSVAVTVGQPPFEEGEVETHWRKQDGTVLDVWVRTVADRDEQGAVVRYRSAAIDLTEQNRLAKELRVRRDELEEKNRQLMTINTELEEFTYVVSHDLREPLRTLKSYGTRLFDECSAQLGVDGFQYINHLITASRRLELLIDDLLDLSQAGRITRSFEAFDLMEAAATARKDLGDLMQRQNATVEIEAALPRVIGDRSRIRQLLTNLIANGLKYNKSPNPEVVVGARVQPGPNGASEVRVWVHDNGIGIDPAHHKQIFGMFRRLHQPGSEYEGTGAGLAICKRIVETHGGRIWVESQPGQGATFFFTLPITPAVTAAGSQRPARTARPGEGTAPADAARPRANPVPAAAPETGGTHVVLVEDDADHAFNIERHSRRAGLVFTAFTTAEDAWEYLQGHQPDLMLFDINLPGMNGIELCTQVRKVAGLRDAPIVLFERDQSPERQAELHAAGADFLLSKDLLATPAVWHQRLQEIVEQIRQPQPS